MCKVLEISSLLVVCVLSGCMSIDEDMVGISEFVMVILMNVVDIIVVDCMLWVFMVVDEVDSFGVIG